MTNSSIKQDVLFVLSFQDGMELPLSGNISDRASMHNFIDEARARSKKLRGDCPDA
jgi:hypothetical protein